MASVLRSLALDSGRVRAVSQPMLVDPDWQDLLTEATDRAYEDGFAAGVAKGRTETEQATMALSAALDTAVTQVTEEIRNNLQAGIQDLARIALSILGELTGELRVDEETLNRRIEDALVDLDGEKLKILVAGDDFDHVTAAFESDSRLDVAIAPDLTQGEVMIAGEWCHADLRWATVLDVLREALDA